MSSSLLLGRPTPRESALARGEPALRFWADVVPHVFGLLVFGKAGRAEFPAETALLEPAPFRLRDVRMEVVDPDGTVAKPRGHPFRAPSILRPHGTGEAVDGVVGDAHCVVFRLLRRGSGEGFDREDRSEGLLLDAGHLRAAAAQDRRQVEIPVLELGTFGARSAHEELCPFGDPARDVLLDLRQVFRRDERAGVGGGIKRATGKDRKSTRLNSSHVAISYAV